MYEIQAMQSGMKRMAAGLRRIQRSVFARLMTRPPKKMLHKDMLRTRGGGGTTNLRVNWSSEGLPKLTRRGQGQGRTASSTAQRAPTHRGQGQAHNSTHARQVAAGAAATVARAAFAADATRAASGRVPRGPAPRGMRGSGLFVRDQNGQKTVDPVSLDRIPVRRAVKIGKQHWNSKTLRGLLKHNPAATNPLTRQPLPPHVVEKYGPKPKVTPPSSLPAQYRDWIKGALEEALRLAQNRQQSSISELVQRGAIIDHYAEYEDGELVESTIYHLRTTPITTLQIQDDEPGAARVYVKIPGARDETVIYVDLTGAIDSWGATPDMRRLIGEVVAAVGRQTRR